MVQLNCGRGGYGRQLAQGTRALTEAFSRCARCRRHRYLCCYRPRALALLAPFLMSDAHCGSRATERCKHCISICALKRRLDLQWVRLHRIPYSSPRALDPEVEHRMCPLQDAGERISRGVAALKDHLAQDAAFYGQLAELQATWKVGLITQRPTSGIWVRGAE